MDGMIQIHQGWVQLAVAGLAFFGWGWRVLNSLEARIEKRLDKLDDRIDKLGDRMTDLEKNMVSLKGTVDSLKEKFDTIERKLDSGPLGMTTAIMAGFKGQMAIPFPNTEPPTPPAPQVEGD
ncbi:MAG: hypothetical protein OXE53_13180 [Deltaproteobacteria bacterium]|nr:hypothetical protein [Deltaproteobacteria bacterium]